MQLVHIPVDHTGKDKTRAGRTSAEKNCLFCGWFGMVRRFGVS